MTSVSTYCINKFIFFLFRTAKLLSAYRPRAGILTVTRSARVARQVSIKIILLIN